MIILVNTVRKQFFPFDSYYVYCMPAFLWDYTICYLSVVFNSENNVYHVLIL